MWNYSTTEATSVRATAARYYSESTRESTLLDSSDGTANSGAAFGSSFFSEDISIVHNNYESQSTIRSLASVYGSFSISPGALTGSNSGSNGATQVIQHGFSFSSTGFTSSANGLSTTSSASLSTVRSLDSYASTTTTQTVAINSDTTTTYTETRAITTSAAGPTTTTASQTITNTTSTTTPATITRTTYAYAPSTTLASPVSLVPVSEANATEQAWQATGAANSAGYPSQIADTFTKRAGTYSTSFTSISATNSQAFTSTGTLAAAGLTTVSLTTTFTTSVSDTYVPTAGSYPAIATATRAFTLLSTRTTTEQWLTSTTFTSAFTFQSTNYVADTSTVLRSSSSLVPITINASPTAIASADFHLTWIGTATVALRTIRPQATSEISSVSAEFTDTTTESASTTYTTTTDVATDTTATTALTETAESNTTTTAVGTSTFTVTTEVSYTTTSNVAAGSTTDSFTSQTDYTFTDILTGSGDDSYTTTFTWTTGVITVNELWSTYITTSESATQSEGAFGTTTYDGAGGATESSTFTYSSYYFESFSSFSIRRSFANTVSFLGDSTTSESSSFSSSTASTDSFSSSYTLDPETYTTTTDSFTSTSITVTTATTTTYVASFTVSGTTTASTTTSATTFVADTTTASAPYSQSSGSSYTQSEGISYTYPILNGLTTATASTPWTAHAMHPRQGFRHPLSLGSSDAMFSVMSILPASLAYPPQATQDDASGPATPILYPRSTSYTVGGVAYTAAWSLGDSRLHVTSGATSDTTTATATFSFSGATPATWYFPKISSAAAQGSLVGGIPAKSEFGVAIYFPSGVRHWTLQQGGISSSETSWLTSPDTSANSSDGFALPATNESAWSVTKRQTLWTYDFFLSAAQSTGDLVSPIMTLSLNPNL